MIVGEKIILRAVQQKDLEYFNIWRNDIEIKNQALLHPFPVTKDLDEDWFNHVSRDKSNKTVFFTIIDKNSQVLGYTFLKEINWINRNSYLGIIIGDNKQRGKGLGKEALNLILDYTFFNLNLNKVLLEVISSNTSAIKLYESLGFVLEGELKQHAYVNGNLKDVRIYSIFKIKK